jgi:oligopeptide transport system permease protein
MPLSIRKFVTELEFAMMLSKKNSEALENFSEKLEVEGRSLWQDARRRFMHNRAAVASLIVLVIIALFVTLAPMVSQFPISIPTGA